MKIVNIANERLDDNFHVSVLGKLEDIEEYVGFTKFMTDFIEEDMDDLYTVWVFGNTISGLKADFKKEVAKELKEFRRKNK